jgi:hypothetical protein
MDEEDSLETVIPPPLLLPPRWLKELPLGFLEPISVWLLPNQRLVVGGLVVPTRHPKVDRSLLLCGVTAASVTVLILDVTEFLLLPRSWLRSMMDAAPFWASGEPTLPVRDTFVAGNFPMPLVLGSIGKTLLVLGSTKWLLTVIRLPFTKTGL